MVVNELPAFFGFVTNQGPTSGSRASAGLCAVEYELADDERVIFAEHFHFDLFKEERAHVDLVGIVGVISLEDAVVATRNVFTYKGDGRGLLIGPDELVDVAAVPGFGLIVENFFDCGFIACRSEGKSKSQYKNQSHARNYSL